jgi:hypothetical protein
VVPKCKDLVWSRQILLFATIPVRHPAAVAQPPRADIFPRNRLAWPKTQLPTEHSMPHPPSDSVAYARSWSAKSVCASSAKTAKEQFATFGQVWKWREHETVSHRAER